MLRRFFGGVHPHDEKGATHRLASTEIAPPPQVILPMDMHAGAPCTPCVAVGDSVEIGQAVAVPTGAGTPIHAGVSGRVTAIEPRPRAGGGSALSVVIDNDFRARRAHPLPRLPFYEELTPEEIIRRVEEAGLAGMGGACFPTHAKLRAALDRVDTVLINAAESEPYITADHRLILDAPEHLLIGVRILMRALGLNRATIGVEGNKTDAVSALQGLLPLRGSDIVVKTLRVRYPQGAERQLVQRMTGRTVPPGGDPIDVGCVVFNAATVAAVRAAVVEGLPVTERVVTVAGPGVVTPGNRIVPIGTPVSHVLDCAGGLTGKAARLLFGGPMTGVALAHCDVPVTKGTNAILALTRVPNPRAGGACLRCGRCVAVCSMRLMPVYLRQFAGAGHLDELERNHLTDCIECGACAYACPARIPLTEHLRAAKAALCEAERDGAAGKEADGNGGA